MSKKSPHPYMCVYFCALYYHLIIHVVIWTKSKCLFIADSLLGPYPCFPIQASNFDDHFGCLQCSLSQNYALRPSTPDFYTHPK